MTPAEFRQLGHQMVDWIASYMERVETLPVLSQSAPGDTTAKLPLHAPESGFERPLQDWNTIFADLDNILLPGLTHWQSPNFYAFFPCNASGPAILAEFLAAGVNVNPMLWTASPAATELETRMLDWMAELIGLPDSFLSTSKAGGGVIQTTASDSTLVAMIAARRRILSRWPTDKTLPHLVAYTSTQAHSSVIKDAMVLGLAKGPDDRTGLRLVNTDAAHAMDPDHLRQLLREDVAASRLPFYVCATVGTTSSTAIDPVDRIASVLAAEGFTDRGGWLHVDAAHAGNACVCPEFRWMLRGVERADSICFNPHKWLLTNFDCDCFHTRDRRSLVDALSITPEYLRNAASEGGRVIDYRDWQIPLGRRFRAIKLWFVLRHYGAEGLRAHIREHVRIAAMLEDLIREDPRFELAAPRTINLVCFRLRGPDADALNHRLLKAINGSGRAYLTHTTLPLPGEPRAVILRMAIGGTMTQERHVRQTWELIRAIATDLAASPPE
jgi:aromatic-L-amino-acid decarboxylase